MKKPNTYFLFFLMFVAIKLTEAQTLCDYGFKKDFLIPVKDSNGLLHTYAWAGGMNSCHFSEIDLNHDGVNDLVSFDKTGNKLLTFINNGAADSINYTYDPYYQKFFPEFTGWVHFIDYNGDGKNDIFSYTPGGIKVYRNISDTTLNFQLLYPMLNSDMGGSTSNISVTYDDYPAIYDIDGDGDLDILCFFGLGTFVEMHKNMSQELYGNNDTLIYELRYHCWGDFSEGAMDNTLNLNISCPWRDDTVAPSKASRHTGSTMLAGDFNNDGLTDLILGDVDYFNIIKLTNGGTTDSAHMTSQDTLFPSNTTPVNFNSFPVASYVDLNNDGNNDLLVSPFTSVTALAENKKSIWLYKNTGTNTNPVFSFAMPDFLQHDMIDAGSGAYPVLYDYNSDGLADIIVGNYGYLDSSYYQLGYLHADFISKLLLLENTGTATNPAFTVRSSDYANLSQLKLIGLIPTFGDLDNDGDVDMICGNSDGKLIYFENVAGIGNIPVYAPPVYNYQGINAGDFSSPQLFDLNNDLLPDLAVGKKNGTISYYQNTGSANNPVFTKITDSLGKVCTADFNLSNWGYSAPCFFKDSNKIKLFTGSEKGNINYFKDIESNLAGKFTASDSILIFIDKDSVTAPINDGIRSGVAVYDFNNDGYKDIVIGNFSGGLTFYYGTKPHPFSNITEITPDNFIGFDIYPNPANSFLTIKFNLNEPDGSLLHLNFYDIVGKKICSKEQPCANEVVVYLTGFPDGFYACQAEVYTQQHILKNLGCRKFIIAR